MNDSNVVEQISRKGMVSYLLHPDQPIIFYLVVEPMSLNNQLVSHHLLTDSVLTTITLNKHFYGKNTSF